MTTIFNIIILILVIIVVVKLLEISRNLRDINKLLRDIWSGLIGGEHGGLSKLSYLEYIDSKLVKIEKNTKKE